MSDTQGTLLKYLAAGILFGMLFALVLMKYIDAQLLYVLIVGALSGLGVHASAALSGKAAPPTAAAAPVPSAPPTAPVPSAPPIP